MRLVRNWMYEYLNYTLHILFYSCLNDECRYRSGLFEWSKMYWNHFSSLIRLLFTSFSIQTETSRLQKIDFPSCMVHRKLKFSNIYCLFWFQVQGVNSLLKYFDWFDTFLADSFQVSPLILLCGSKLELFFFFNLYFWHQSKVTQYHHKLLKKESWRFDSPGSS